MRKAGHRRPSALRVGLTLAIAAVAAISSAASATAASITVTPSSGLTRSGHNVTVDGTGFAASSSIEIRQCREQENFGRCWLVGSTEANGAGSFSKVVQVFYRAPGFDSCEDAYCKIYAAGYDWETDDYRLSSYVPISFAGATATTSTPSPGAGGSVAIGLPVTDTAVVTGNGTGGSPTGQMSFWVCGPDGYVVCAEGGNPVAGNPRPISPGPNNSASATSGTFTPTAIGRYCFRSLYFGDTTNGASFDARQRECFYAKAVSQTTSSVSAPWGQYPWSVPDTAVVTGTVAGGTPTGTVVFHICVEVEEPEICEEGAEDFNNWDTLAPGPKNTATASVAGGIVGIPPGRICYRTEYQGSQRYLPSSHASAEDCFVAGYYPRPTGATPLRVPLVPAFKRCTEPNKTHGAPLSFGSCGPPAPESSRIHIGVGDGDPAPAKSIGFLLLKSVVGYSGDEEDDSDISIRTSITNVMNASDRSDYTGELQAAFNIRLTDREAFGELAPQTTEDFSFRFTVGCAATADTTVGATCAVTTSGDSVLPGAVAEGVRSIWALDEIKVYDGGPDADAETTGDNLPFAVQGVLVP